MPTYKVERLSKESGIKRLLKLGRRLAWADAGSKRIVLHVPAVRNDFLKVSNNEHLKQLVSKL